MTLSHEAIKKLEKILEDSGCEDGIVSLSVNYDTDVCQYPRGVCMEAQFGGKSGWFVTNNPIRADTRISFMYGAPLNDPKQRGAAIAIINAVSAFFCLSRKYQACTPTATRPASQTSLARSPGDAYTSLARCRCSSAPSPARSLIRQKLRI